MINFTITKKQHVNDHRQGEHKNFNSIWEAKEYAEKSQCFYNTVLTVEIADELIAYKEGGKNWIDVW